MGWEENKLPQATRAWRGLCAHYHIQIKVFKKKKKGLKLPETISTGSVFIKVIGKILISFEEGSNTTVAGAKFSLLLNIVLHITLAKLGATSKPAQNFLFLISVLPCGLGNCHC